MIIDLNPLYPPFLKYSQAEKHEKTSQKFHPSTNTYDSTHAQPNQSTNHRRMKRNGLESQFPRRSAQNLLIAQKGFCLPPFLPLLSLLH